MTKIDTPVRRATSSRQGFVFFGVGLFAAVLALVAWFAASRIDGRRETLHELIGKQKLQVSQITATGRIVADVVFGELRQAMKAADLPAGPGIGNLRQEGDYYEYLYGRPGATKDVARLMTGNLVGLAPAKTDAQLPRLQKVMQHLYERDLNILGQNWSSRVAYTYWMSRDQKYLFSVPRWDFEAAIAASPQKTATSAMGQLAQAMLTPYESEVKVGETQVFRTDAWIDAADGRALQTMVSPMFDAKGEWLGNAAVDFGLEEIDQTLAESGMEVAQWLLVTPRRTVLARHVDAQGALDKLVWGKPLTAAALALPDPTDGTETTVGDYRVSVAAVPGSDLYLYLLMPAKWIHQDLPMVLMAGAAALLLLTFGLAVVWRYQRRREQLAEDEIRKAEDMTRQEAERHERSLQLKAWAGRLAKALQQGEDDAANFGRIVLAELVPELGGCVAVFYLRAADAETFRCVAGYGIAIERCQPFQPGEAMGGAAVLSQQPIIYRDIPPGYLAIESGTLDIDPREIAAIPVRIGDAVWALIEIGYLEAPREQEDILAEALPVIAFSLELMLGKQAALEDLKERAAIEERQGLIFASITDGIFGQDLDGRVTFINAAAEHMLGYEAGELLHQRMHAATHHHYADGTEFPRERCAMYLTTCDGESRTVADEVFWRKDGSSFPIEYATTPLRKEGKLQGAVISFRDIGERLKHQREVERLLKEQQALFDAAPVGIFYTGDGVIVRANRQMGLMYGWPDGSAVGRRSTEIHVSDESLKEFGALAGPRLARGEPVSEVWPQRRADGSQFVARISGQALAMEGYRFASVWTIEDVTERQLAEKRLSDNEAKVRQIFETANEGIWIIDLETRSVEANRAMCAILGRAPEEIAGRPIFEFVDAENEAIFKEQIRLRKEGKTGAYEIALSRPDGSRVPCLFNATPMFDRDGKRIGSFAMVADITERKQSEARMAAERELLQLILDTSPINVAFSTKGKIHFANPIFCETFGIKVGDASPQLYVDPQERDKLVERLKRDGAVRNHEIRMYDHRKQVRDMLINYLPIRYDGEDGILGWIMDITGRNRLADMELFNRLAQGRERRIVELKREINALAAEVGRALPYAAPDATETAEVQVETVAEVAAAEDAGMVKQEFIGLVQREQLQDLFNGFCQSVGIAAAIIDLQGVVLAAARWQRACTDFHRVNEKSCANCIESDTGLALQLQEGQDFTMYRCKNGMTDCAAPIVVDGHHVANVFIGQFHVQPPDEAFFRNQAAAFGFDADQYWAAVQEAPVMDEAKLPHILGFLARFARLLGAFAIEQRRAKQAEARSTAQALAMQRERVAALSLAEDAEKARQELTAYQGQLEQIVAERTAKLEQVAAEVGQSEERLRQVLEDSPAGVTVVDEAGNQLFFNRRLADMLGIPLDQMQTRRSSEFWADPDERPAFVERLKREGRIDDFEVRMRCEDGSIIWVLLNTRWIVLNQQRLLLSWLYEITERKQAESKSEERMQELEKFSRLSIDREEEVMRLQEEINGLLEQAGKEKKYRIGDSL